MATLLDPEYSLILSNEQIEEGTSYLKELVKDFIDMQETEQTKERDRKEEINPTINKEVFEPPLKKFRHLSKIVSQQISKQNKTLPALEEQEVDLFIQQRVCINLQEVIGALDYWVKSESMFPILSKVACDVL